MLSCCLCLNYLLHESVKPFFMLIGIALQTIFKMDRYGNGEEMMLDKIFNSASCTPSFRDFDKELLTGELLVPPPPYILAIEM